MRGVGAGGLSVQSGNAEGGEMPTATELKDGGHVGGV